MYTQKNFKNKKAVKDAIKAGEKITVFSAGLFPAPTEGKVSLEGPHFPAPHTWYGTGTLKDGILISIK